jgi:hypothetical protein
VDRRLVRILRVAGGGLAILLAIQLYWYANEEDPFAGIDFSESVVVAKVDASPAHPPAGASAEKSPSTVVASAPEQPPKAPASAGPPDGAPKETAPKQYDMVQTSGIFGKVPAKETPPPVLFGFIGRYAILQAPDGAIDLVPEGGEIGGVKVLKIGVNRAVVLFQGNEMELMVFDGLGSAPLTTPQKKE